MIPKWLYRGVHHDPHPRFWLPDMREYIPDPKAGLDAALIETCIPPKEVPAFQIRTTLLPGLGATAYAFREAWATHIDKSNPVASLFITTEQFDTDDDTVRIAKALLAAEMAFPAVWKRFARLTLGETCTYSPKSSAPSVSSTLAMESRFEPESTSAKSSA